MIFVDTGPLVARWMRQDALHDRAVQIWERLGREHLRLATSSHVLDEVATLLGRRAGNRFAAERIRRIHASEAFTILRPGEDLELQALELLVRYADQVVSHTDCLAFELMRAQRIRRVFTFDHHFRIAGFEVLDR